MENSIRNKILVLYDFSEPSENAVEYAIQLGIKSNFDVHILNVQNFPVSDMVLIANFTQNYNIQLDAALVELSKIKARYSEYSNISYNAEFGEVAHAAQDFCENNPVVCVVMGIKSRNSFLVKWFGSNTTAVINALKVPVLLIPKEHKFKTDLNIAFASDKKPDESKYLLLLHSLLGQYINNFLWVHFGQLKEKHLMPELKIQELMVKLFPKTSHHVENTGEIQEALAEITKNNEVDILVMRTSHKNLISRLTSTSISREYSYKTTIPLLIFTS